MVYEIYWANVVLLFVSNIIVNAYIVNNKGLIKSVHPNIHAILGFWAVATVAYSFAIILYWSVN